MKPENYGSDFFLGDFKSKGYIWELDKSFLLFSTPKAFWNFICSQFLLTNIVWSLTGSWTQKMHNELNWNKTKLKSTKNKMESFLLSNTKLENTVYHIKFSSIFTIYLLPNTCIIPLWHSTERYIYINYEVINYWRCAKFVSNPRPESLLQLLQTSFHEA